MGASLSFRFFFLCLLWTTVAAQLPTYHDIHELASLRPLLTRNASLPPLLSHVDYADLYPARSSAENSLPSLSKECAADIKLVAASLERVYGSLKGLGNLSDFDKTVVFGLIDASGKPGPGFLRGHATFYGLYTQCSKLQSYLTDQKREFTAQYSRLTIDIATQTCDATTSQLIAWDLCVPSTCNDTELLDVFQAAKSLKKKIPIPMKMCRVRSIADQRKSLSWRGWLVSGLLIMIAFLGVTASVYEYLVLPQHAHLKYSQGTLIAIWRSFSFYSNITAIFKTKQSAKEGQIGPIHCMRFVTMCWIIMGHSVIFFLTYGTNPLDLYDTIGTVYMQIVVNAYFAVDTFFFQSGLLLAFVWFKKYRQNPRAMNSVSGWFLFYFHRIVRLSPAYFLAIALYTWVYPTWLYNMPAFLSADSSSDVHACETHWWANFLYVNNYMDMKNQCYGVSWYLAADMQMYLFAPIILVPFALNMKAGLLASVAVLVLSTIGNVVTVVHYYFGPTIVPIPGAQVDKRMGTQDMYWKLMYGAPWIRCQVYVIGMLVGYFLRSRKHLKIHPIVNVAGWLLSLALMATVVFSLRGYFDGTYMDLGYRAVYSALSKPAWGLALSWIIISCYYGHGGILNAFMSWSGWIPLGRLSYSAYLIHWMVVVYYSGMPQAGWLYTSFPEMLIEFSIPVIVLTFFFSILWSSGLEISFSRVEDILVKCFMPTPAVKPMNGDAHVDVWKEANKEKFPLDVGPSLPVEMQNGTTDVPEGVKL